MDVVVAHQQASLVEGFKKALEMASTFATPRCEWCDQRVPERKGEPYTWCSTSCAKERVLYDRTQKAYRELLGELDCILNKHSRRIVDAISGVGNRASQKETESDSGDSSS